MPSLRLLADDLTGALDTAAEFVGMCGPIGVTWAEALPSQLPACLAVDTGTRERDKAESVAIVERLAPLGRYLGRAVKDGADREARAALSLASLYGGFCLGPVNTTAGHAVAYPLGTRHHIAHGLACAVIFPHTLAFNMPAVEAKTEAVLEALGAPATKDSAAAFETAYRFCADLGIEMKLSALAVPANDLGAMADEAHAIRRLLGNNPREPSRDAILKMYQAAF
jgi:alcohol dehydrogenase class IV